MKANMQRELSFLSLFLVAGMLPAGVFMATISVCAAETIFESGTLGPTGIPWSDLTSGAILGANISKTTFNGVRFQLDQPTATTKVGGHFVAPLNGTLFGAIVELDDENDFPDSGDLSTPDVLGHSLLTFPVLSDEVFGNISLSLAPGWYALVFGSGLFGASGYGGMVLNNPDIGDPSYFGFLSSFWVNLSPPSDIVFNDYRLVVKGNIIPEPSTYFLTLLLFVSLLLCRQTPLQHASTH